MNRRLTELLTEMGAGYPDYNPDCRQPLPHREEVCTVVLLEQEGREVEFTDQENGVLANLIYTCNGGERYEEWFRQPASFRSGMKAVAHLPEGTTHYFINLIDEIWDIDRPQTVALL